MSVRFTLLILAVGIAAATTMTAQPTEPLRPADREIQLYPGDAPGSEAWNWHERTIFNTVVSLEFAQNVVR